MITLRRQYKQRVGSLTLMVVLQLVRKHFTCSRALHAFFSSFLLHLLNLIFSSMPLVIIQYQIYPHSGQMKYNLEI